VFFNINLLYRHFVLGGILCAGGGFTRTPPKACGQPKGIPLRFAQAVFFFYKKAPNPNRDFPVCRTLFDFRFELGRLHYPMYKEDKQDEKMFF
jgi:hypothetical protein